MSFVINAPSHPEVISYSWDEWGQQEDASSELPNPELASDLSQRACMALVAAVASWLLARYEFLTDLTLPRQCLEAAWLQGISPLYSRYWGLDEDEWNGPIRGPIRRGIDYLSVEVEEALKGVNSGWGAGHIVRLVHYVRTDHDAFDAWLDKVLQRLRLMHRLDPEDPLGDVVDPELFDLNSRLAPEKAARHVAERLAAVNYLENPFLTFPDEMVRGGFEGTPYQFDFEQDRRFRLDW